MSTTDDNSLELRRIRRMLKQLYSLAEHSSLTGALAAGAVDAVEQYNRILERLEALGVTSGGLFKPLPEDASFDRLGVASKLLEGYLAEETVQPERTNSGDSNNVFIGNIGNLDELKDLGRVIRENLPDFLKKRGETPAPPASPVPPESPQASEAPTAPRPTAAPEAAAPIPMPDIVR